MNTVVELARYFPPRNVPILVLVDVCHSDPYFTTSAATEATSRVLTNCKKALAHARAMRFPVAFVRKSDTYSAAYATPGVGNWLPGLEPQRFDMVFERSRDSCYESQAFDEMMKYSYHKFILAGFGEIAFFATAVDAYRREHAFIYLADAVISCEFGDASAIRLQRAIVNAINFFGQVTTTRIWTQGIPQNLVLTR